MRGDTNSTTKWECDGKCGEYIVLTGGYQHIPPPGWRLLHVLPINVNMALEGEPHRVYSLCANCFDAFKGLLKDE